MLSSGPQLHPRQGHPLVGIHLWILRSKKSRPCAWLKCSGQQSEDGSIPYNFKQNHRKKGRRESFLFGWFLFLCFRLLHHRCPILTTPNTETNEMSLFAWPSKEVPCYVQKERSLSKASSGRFWSVFGDFFFPYVKTLWKQNWMSSFASLTQAFICSKYRKLQHHEPHHSLVPTNASSLCLQNFYIICLEPSQLPTHKQTNNQVICFGDFVPSLLKGRQVLRQKIINV